MRRPAHKIAHAECPFGATDWATCEKAQKVAMGQCVALTEKETQCTNWAVGRVNDRPHCGQHYASVMEKDRRARIAAERAETLNRTIDAYLALSGQEAHDCVASRCYWGESRRRRPDFTVAG